MDFYSLQRVARIEHEQMTRSLSPVPEFGSHEIAQQPGWLSRQVRALLFALGNRLMSLSNQTMQRQDRSLVKQK